MKNKHVIGSLALLLIGLMLLIPLPIGNSLVTERQFTLFAAAGPNKIGLGQSTQIVVWANVNPSTYLPVNLSAGEGLLRFAKYHNYVVSITDPDGITDNRTIKETDSLGTVSFSYTPTKLGNYTIVGYYPGESFENVQYFKTPVSFKAAQSRPATLVVQQEQITGWVETPLPQEYWTRPIDASNQLWASQTSN
jgi:hypothetical protein